MSVLIIDGLQVALPPGGDREWAVDQVSLSIEAGQTLCVVGESGSGKSVMAFAVMGLLAPELKIRSGSIKINGTEVTKLSAAQLRAMRGPIMSMVFQEPMTALNPVMRCGEQVDELLRQHTTLDATTRRNKILDIFARVRLPEPQRMYDSFPHQLSGGQRQRIVIAMAVILRPKLLICDEPTTALDVTTQKEILSLINELQAEQGSAVLFITHDMGIVHDIADRVLVMNQGRMVELGPQDQVLREPREAYTKMLLAAVPSMKPPPAREIPAGPAVLRAVKVDKTYSSGTWFGAGRQTHALKQANLHLQAGQTIGIVGESGSGKSTFARCLIRLIDPTAGSIYWGEQEVATRPESELRPLRSQIQVVFQDPNRSLNPRMRIRDVISEGAINNGKSREQAYSQAALLMQKVQLPTEGLDRYSNQFSGGQRQRLAIARALACEPKVLIADEAVSALDVSVQAQIMQLLRDIQADLGLGLLFITHDLRVAAQLCDRIIVMYQGEIVEEGPTAALYSNPQHDYTRVLLAAAPGQQALYAY